MDNHDSGTFVVVLLSPFHFHLILHPVIHLWSPLAADNTLPMKKINYCILILLLHCITPLIAQEGKPNRLENKKGTFYFYYGYNRAIYSKTNLHFSGPNYDFTLYDLKGSDRPSKFNATYINPTTFSVPQYNYRLGYFFTKNFALSAGIDHMKYVMNKNQPSVISGVITNEASPTYAGTYLNHPIIVKEDLLTFEHTNGFNFVTLELEYIPKVASVCKGKIAMLWNTGIGGVWVVTKTDVRVMNDGLDNRFHLSGYALALKTGPRIEYNHRFFLAGEAKGGYATLPDVLIKNSSPERADHNLGFLEYYVVGGINFRL